MSHLPQPSTDDSGGSGSGPATGNSGQHRRDARGEPGRALVLVDLTVRASAARPLDHQGGQRAQHLIDDARAAGDPVVHLQTTHGEPVTTVPAGDIVAASAAADAFSSTPGLAGELRSRGVGRVSVVAADPAPDEQATLDQQARPGDDFDDLIDAAPDIGPVDWDDTWALRADPDYVRDCDSAEDAPRSSAGAKIAGRIKEKAGGG